MQIGTALVQSSFDMIFEEIRRVLRFLTENLHVVSTHHRVIEIIHHARSHHAHIVTFAGINKQVGLDLGHIAEETIYFLCGDQADLSAFDECHQSWHAFAVSQFSRAAHASIHVDHLDTVSRPSLTDEMFKHIDGL